MSVIEQKSLLNQEETNQEHQEIGNEFDPISIVKVSENDSDKTVNMEELNETENQS